MMTTPTPMLGFLALYIPRTRAKSQRYLAAGLLTAMLVRTLGMRRVLLGLRPFAYKLLTAAKAEYDTQLRPLPDNVETIQTLQATVATQDTTIAHLTTNVADLHEAARVQRVTATEISADLKVQVHNLKIRLHRTTECAAQNTKALQTVVASKDATLAARDNTITELRAQVAALHEAARVQRVTATTISADLKVELHNTKIQLHRTEERAQRDLTELRTAFSTLQQEHRALDIAATSTAAVSAIRLAHAQQDNVAVKGLAAAAIATLADCRRKHQLEMKAVASAAKRTQIQLFQCKRVLAAVADEAVTAQNALRQVTAERDTMAAANDQLASELRATKTRVAALDASSMAALEREHQARLDTNRTMDEQRTVHHERLQAARTQHQALDNTMQTMANRHAARLAEAAAHLADADVWRARAHAARISQLIIRDVQQRKLQDQIRTLQIALDTANANRQADDQAHAVATSVLETRHEHEVRVRNQEYAAMMLQRDRRIRDLEATRRLGGVFRKKKR
ncbi:hypothetical protein SDRG_01251 [Saprolegnia diclina VS20]|uniref:Uncharacterized protein n=1 Tax=Saprolegnia diclina (strain VS20) TaxID=1156394 RepID=T0R2U0_SAPDV|nr:hypothetical protein SDRG_01251 [Saprolegnia diclina VS20]EQC41276.1 hypothetical protein SDRG_01251 [Saprolegnia diclina VS20]|eukprot:XP_008604990.1 hypothetical protein SDRG_01251 [Saprolegnia diclina VS20]